jgi:DNA-binding transcriptional ArsR family regulator
MIFIVKIIFYAKGNFMESFEPAQVHIIKDLDAAKAISDPLRLQIIEVMIPAPLTVSQIAAKLGLAQSKLYYHVNTLEKHGLIRLVDTTVHGNIIEKHYWVTAYDYHLDGELYNFNVTEPEGKENIISMFLTSLDTVREDFARSIEARAFNLEHGANPRPRRVINAREIGRIPDDKMEIFQKKLNELIHEFAEMDVSDTDKSHPWALNVFLYPTFYFEDQESDE